MTIQSLTLQANNLDDEGDLYFICQLETKDP